jgi:hypothetical protein
MVQNVKESFLKDMTHSLRITIDGTQVLIDALNDVPVPTIVGNVMIIEESELEGEEDEE